MKPLRIQRSRKQKQVSPNGLPIKYVGRPTIWGNPFKDVGDLVYVNAKYRRKSLPPWVVYHSTKGAAELFDDMCRDLDSHPVEEPIRLRFENIREHISELKGLNLSCWCSNQCQCHADTLLTLANIT